MEKICMVFSIMPLYRKPIYKMIDNEYECDWFFEAEGNDIKTFDEKELKRVSRLPVFHFGPFFILKGQIGLLRKNYKTYFFLGSTRNISLFLSLLLRRTIYRKKRIYLWTHGLYGKESLMEWLFWKRPMLKMADGLFTYGDYAKKLLVEKGFDKNKIFPIHNSLDYDVQLELRNKLVSSDLYQQHFGNNYPVLVFIGRLTPVKRLDMLLNAVAILKKKGEQYNIVFIGDGTERESLTNLCNSLDLHNNVWFYGACYDEVENAKLVYNADLCVAPGNIGLTAMHSLMFGCPAVSHNDFAMQMPEFEAIVPNVTGDFYKFGSSESLAETISTWFNNHKDDRDCVREACYQVIDKAWNPYYQMEVIKKNLK